MMAVVLSGPRCGLKSAVGRSRSVGTARCVGLSHARRRAEEAGKQCYVKRWPRGSTTSTSTVPPPPAPTRWSTLYVGEKPLIPALEPYGSHMVTVGSLCFLGAWAMEDVAALRAMSLAGSTLFFAYYASHRPPLVIPAAWGSLNILINGTMLVLLLIKSTSSIEFTADEVELFEEHFAPSGVHASEFKALLELGHWRTAEQGEELARHGAAIDRVALVFKGEVRATDAHGRRVVALDTFPGRRRVCAVGDAGAWIGELALLQALDEAALSSSSSSTKATGAASVAPPVEETPLDDAHLQAALRLLGFYDGPIDGDLNTFESSRAVRHFQGAAGLSEDGDAGPLTRRAASVLKRRDIMADSSAAAATAPRRSSPALPEQTLLLGRDDRKVALTTLTCSGTVRLIEWSLPELTTALRKNLELERAVRRALSSAAVRKAIASMSIVHPPSQIPRRLSSSGGAFGVTDETFHTYCEELKKATATGYIDPEAKHRLRRSRVRSFLSAAEHRRALETLRPRWTLDEYNDGALQAALSKRGVPNNERRPANPPTAPPPPAPRPTWRAALTSWLYLPSWAAATSPPRTADPAPAADAPSPAPPAPPVDLRPTTLAARLSASSSSSSSPQIAG